MAALTYLSALKFVINILFFKLKNNRVYTSVIEIQEHDLV